MKIAVLGGRFDPPHIGHYIIAKQILEIRKDIEKIILVPTATHQWKPAEATGEQRLSMLSPFVDSGIEVSDMEIKRGGISYSVDTVKMLKKETNANIFWVVGADILSEFERWENTNELTKLATFLVFPRDPYHLPKTLPEGFELVIDEALISTNLSSTLIRKRVKEGKPIKHLVLPETEKYILQHHLYE